MDLHRTVRDMRLRDSNDRAVKDSAAQEFEVQGQLRFSGVGEASCVVNFPFKYREKPILSTGWELAPGQTLRAGMYPLVSIGVADWTMLEDGQFRRYFTGATIAVRADGDPGQKLIVFWTFKGKGFMNPVVA